MIGMLILAAAIGLVLGLSGKFYIYQEDTLIYEMDRLVWKVPGAKAYVARMCGIEITDNTMSPVYLPLIAFTRHDRIIGITISTGYTSGLIIMLAAMFPFIKIEYDKNMLVSTGVELNE